MHIIGCSIYSESENIHLMRLSIAIVNWNTSRLLESCLNSIYRNKPPFEFEVIVVDNGSDDFDESRFREQFSATKIIRNDQNIGYAAANNQAMNTASGEYILLLNPDTEVLSGTLDLLVKFMDEHADAAAAGCRLVKPNGMVDRSVRSFPDPLAIAADFLFLSRLFPRSRLFGRYRMTWFNYDEDIEVDQPMGSCLILRSEAVKQIGVMDEQFPIFFNDVDWCYRAKLAGWKIYFTRSAEVVHHGGASTRQVRKQMIHESHKSLIDFYRKHYKGRIFAPIYWFTITAIKLSDILTARLPVLWKSR